METLPSVCVDDTINDEEHDSELWRLLVKEREGTLSEENIKLIERSRCLNREYHTLKNVNPNDENDEQTVRLDRFESYLQESGSTMEDVFDNIELQLSDISGIMTRFTADDYKNRRILEMSKRIERNIAECCSLTTNAKAILAEKMNLQRELNSLNEQLSYHTLEDPKYRRIQKRRGTECAKTGSFRRTYFCRFGIPYFKTKDRFPAEQNEDLKEIIRNSEVMVIRMPPIRRILQHDTRTLDASILNQLKSKRIQQLQKRLKQLEKSEDGNADYEQQTQNLLKAIEHTRSVNDIRETKDWNIDVNFFALPKLNTRFSVDDYERMWQLLGHPSLSREEFTKDELVELKRLVHEHESQNWDRIAERLDTNRSGFVCFNKWVCLTRKGTRKPWTKKEDDLLRKLCGKIDEIKDSANLYHYWRYIRRQFPHRSYTQIHGHWMYKLAPTLKKGRFTEVETEKLERLIREGKSFGEIASIFQTRSSVQLRSHYNQIVERASSNSGTWAQDEEIALFRLVEIYGTNNWVQISKELGTRNRSQCRLKFLQCAWTPSETQRFQALIEEYGTDFEKVSQEMGTKSATQCRVKFLRQKESESTVTYNEGRWTRKETRLFRNLVDKYNQDFALISQELKTRNAEQCQEKYERMTQRNAKYPIKRIEVKVLDGAQEDRILKIYKDDTKLAVLTRTARWTQSEKNKFIKLIEEHGPQFDKISRELGTKSIKQCRNMHLKVKQNEIEEEALEKSEDNKGKTKKSCQITAKRKHAYDSTSSSSACSGSVRTDEFEHCENEGNTNNPVRTGDPLKENAEVKTPITKKVRMKV